MTSLISQGLGFIFFVFEDIFVKHVVSHADCDATNNDGLSSYSKLDDVKRNWEFLVSVLESVRSDSDC